MTETEKEAEQVQWERRLEEFCEAREEAVEVLKSGGGDFRNVEKLNFDGKAKLENVKKRSEKTQQISSSQAHKSYSVKVKESRKGDSHSKTHHAKKTQVER